MPSPPSFGPVLTLATIDFVIQRGTQLDWIRPHTAAMADRKILDDIRAVCEAQITDRDEPWLDGHRAWLAYVDSVMTCDERTLRCFGRHSSMPEDDSIPGLDLDANPPTRAARPRPPGQ